MRGIWVSGLMAVVLLGGCANDFGDSLSGRNGADDGNAPSAVEASETGEMPPRSTGRLQQAVMDFSDRFSNELGQAVAGYIAAEPDVTRQVRAQRLRLGLDTTAMTIAASLDPRANLLDMAVFISAGRWAADQYWVPQWLGPKAAGLSEVYAAAEREIWAEVDRILTPAQGADLRALIEEWKKTANPADVVNVRLRNLDGVALSHFQEAASAKGLLASVRRLLGRVDQSLLYGERMMFYLQRTPLILSQQADLTVDRVAERFPIATANPDFAAWQKSAEEFGRSLPQRFGAALAQNDGLIRDVLPRVQGSLESVERIAVSLQGTVNSARDLATTVGEASLRPEDYAGMLDRTTATLERLDRLVTGLNELLDDERPAGGVSPAARLARVLDERADRAMDAIYYRALWLIAFFIGGLLLVVIVARLLFPPPRVRPTPGNVS